MNIRTPRVLWAAMLSAGLLSACGGGGGGDSSETAPPPASATSVAVTGVAAKGLLSNADVAVYGVDTAGAVGVAPVATTTTDATGGYSLKFDGTAGAHYVVVVSAKADGSTRHADEATGVDQPLPATFKIRGLLTAPAAGETAAKTLSITPFSELAVAAAANAGGLTAANIAEAKATVQQLLGFDPTAVTPKKTADATTPTEQQLAVLLTAVSKLAEKGALGCDAAAGGDKTACVVDKLSKAANSKSLNLSTGGTNVSAALGEAVETVLTSPTLSGGIPASLLKGVQGGLGCAEDACKPAAPVDLDSSAKAIAAAKALFTEIRSDVTALFAKGGVNSSSPAGTLNAEAFKFRQALTDVRLPADVMVRDVGAMVYCLNKLIATGDADRFYPFAGDYRAIDQSPIQQETTSSGIGCTVAYSSATGKKVVSGGVVYASDTASSANGVQTLVWRHTFTLEPGANGTYTYLSSANKRTIAPDNSSMRTPLQVVDGQPRRFSGTLTPTVDGGRITGFALKGELPGAFGLDGKSLANDHHTVEVNGAYSGTQESGNVKLAGSLTAFSDASTAVGTFAVREASVTDSRIGVIDLLWTSANAEFEGKLMANDPVKDKSAAEWIPSKLQLSGALRNVADGKKTEFLSGELTAAAKGYEAFDSTLPVTAQNNYVLDLSFVGKATAPGRPVMEITFAASQPAEGQFDVTTGLLQYRSIVDGKARNVVAMTMGQGDARGKRAWRIEAPASALTLSWTGVTSLDAADGAVLRHGDTTIGSFSAKDALLRFTDGSSVSLDFGL